MWIIVFCLAILYGWILFTPTYYRWLTTPSIIEVDSTDYRVSNLPFPAVTICSNNKVVERQVESVLLLEPWRSLRLQDPEHFPRDFRSAITSLVMYKELPSMLRKLNNATIQLLSEYKEELPELMKKVCNIQL